MKNNNTHSNNDLPSMGKLIKSTLLAIVIATIILITVVLPAEYGIDPIGVGSMLGLTKMGEIKVSLSEEAASEQQADPEKLMVKIEPAENSEPVKVEDNNNTDLKSDKFTIELKPGEGKEIKLTMAKGAKVDFLWYTDGGIANFDTHADSKILEIKYHNYEKGKLEKSEGTLEAAFNGNHGWFWRNRTTEDMSVTLKVNGSYTNVVQY